MRPPSQRLPPARRMVLPIACGAVLVAGVASTTFVNADDPLAAGEAVFSAEEYVAEAFPEIVEAISQNATELTIIAAAVAEDPAAAGAEYGVDLGASQYVYRVTAVGEVDEVDDDFAYIAVVDPSDPSDTLDLRIPLGSALSGTPVRDATGTIQFGDFADQNEYQSVANQLKLKIAADVLGPVDPPSLVGQVVAVTGAWVPIGPAGTFIVQPVAVEVVP